MVLGYSGALAILFLTIVNKYVFDTLIARGPGLTENLKFSH